MGQSLLKTFGNTLRGFKKSTAEKRLKGWHRKVRRHASTTVGQQTNTSKKERIRLKTIYGQMAANKK